MRLIPRRATLPRMSQTTRYTSREAAERLGVLSFDAIHLLRAASVPSVRHGSGILWDAAAVERLVETLAKPATSQPADAGEKAPA